MTDLKFKILSWRYILNGKILAWYTWGPGLEGQPELGSNSWSSRGLSLPSAGVIGVCHYSQLQTLGTFSIFSIEFKWISEERWHAKNKQNPETCSIISMTKINYKKQWKFEPGEGLHVIPTLQRRQEDGELEATPGYIGPYFNKNNHIVVELAQWLRAQETSREPGFDSQHP